MSFPIAMIYVDGERFIDCFPDDDRLPEEYYRETVERVGGEVALLVWKPRHGIYLRTKLSVTTDKVYH